LSQYQHDGYATGIRVADDSEATRYRTLFEEIELREGREKCQKGLFDLHFSVPFIWELASHPIVLDHVESILGPNILLMGTHFFCKYGPSEAFVAWHQDVTYWGLEPPIAVTAWYAIDDSDQANGCMQVIPGTHRDGIRAHGKSAQSNTNLLSINQELAISPEELASVQNIELQAGEISLHDGMTIHGSPPNRSDRRRCGLAMIYLPTYVKQAAENSLGTRWPAVLVRGENQEQYFEDRPRPFSP
jgi:ectoine hydroxylase-related dioxygenase (phytanoyl-CoA dioxygenase family)